MYIQPDTLILLFQNFFLKLDFILTRINSNYGAFKMELKVPKIATMDDIDLKNKSVLVRVDFNSPVDPKTKKILDDTRLRAHLITIKELMEKHKAKTVLIAHQGRPGTSDFISLEPHAKRLSELLNQDVKFIDDIIGPYARETIKNLEPGEVLILDNIRLLSEENINAKPEVQAKTFLVRKLSPLFDAFVLDAFGTAHRSQPSLVGFPVVLPSVAGRVMEKEVRALERIVSGTEGPKIFVLGGAKVDDSIRIIETLVRNKVADRIILTGLLSEIFLLAKGISLGEENMKVLREKGILDLVRDARSILLKGAPIETPIDFVTLQNGEVDSVPTTKIQGLIRDIGDETIKMYSELMKDAELIVMRGPAGVMEDPRFRKGTEELAKAALNSKAFVIFGGGHLTAIAHTVGYDEERVHLSTGGGALLTFLSGEPLPALEALHLSGKKFIWGE